MNEDAKWEELAQGLGARAAERVDAERVATAVLARMRSEPRAAPPAPPSWAQPPWLRIAAAVLILLGGGLVTRALWERGPGHTGHYVAEDLSGLSTTELQGLLAMLEETLDLNAPPSSDPSLDELTEEQLQTMLRSLEG